MDRALKFFTSYIRLYTQPGIGQSHIKSLSVSPGVYLQHIQIRHAGHSQWANRRHGKALEDDKKAKVINQTIFKIRIAIREGGPDPKTNSQLAKALEFGSKNNVPANTLKKAIDRMLTLKDRLKQEKVEVRGPNGSFIIFDLATENMNKTKKDIKKIIARNFGGEVMSKGGSRFHFQEKGIITVCAKEDSPPLTMEDVEEIAIEVDAEEVKAVSEESDDGAKTQFELLCDSENLYAVLKNLSDTNLEMLEFKVALLPNDLVDLSDDDKENVDQAIHLIKSLVEPSVFVEHVYDNINW